MLRSLSVRSLGAFAVLLALATGASAQNSTNFGPAVVHYLQSREGQRIGGGNSADLAVEALRIAGAEFVADDLGADAPAAGDRAWGTLVTEISPAGDSQSANACLPGDILQLGNAELNGKPCPAKFTAVVAEVNGGGRPKKIFCQELDGNRTVKLLSINIEQFNSGWMRVYRPKARINRTDEWKITIVNNTTASQGYEVYAGVEVNAAVQAAAVNTAGSFFTHRVPTDGTVPNIYTANGRSYFLEHGKAYELYSSTTGVEIRQFAQ